MNDLADELLNKTLIRIIGIGNIKFKFNLNECVVVCCLCNNNNENHNRIESSIFVLYNNIFHNETTIQQFVFIFSFAALKSSYIHLKLDYTVLCNYIT